MIFKSKKSFLSVSIIYFVIALLVGLSIYGLITNGLNIGNIFFFFLTLVFVTLFFWVLFVTYYQITATHINYNWGPVKGKIEIKNIKDITANKTLWVGFRPALGFKGVIIKYNKYDEIYFSPIDNEAFINELLKVNHEIKVN